MSWAIDTNGLLTHTGTTLEVWDLLDDTQDVPGSFTLRVPFQSVDHEIRVCVLMSADGKTRWEAGFANDGLNSTGGALATSKVMLRRYVQGVAEQVIVGNDANHGIAAGIPGELVVTVTSSTIVVLVQTSGVSGTTFTYTNSTPPTYLEYARIGIASDVNNAVAGPCVLTELTAIPQSISNLLGACAGGSIFGCYDGTVPLPSWTQIAFRVMPPSGPVSACNFQAKSYFLGGQSCYEVDWVNRTATLLTANAGSLPGQTEAGVFGATIVREFGPRLIFAYKNELWFSAVDDPRDWDTGDTIDGSAVVLIFDEPIVAIETNTMLNFMLVSTASCMYVLQGDPIVFAGNLTRALIARGVSATGPDAMWTTDDGRIMVGAQSGLWLVSGPVPPINISQQTLRKYITISGPVSKYHQQIVQEPGKGVIYSFMSRTDDGDAVHVVYDYASAGFDPSAGGYFIDTYFDTDGPTASALWNGRVVTGWSDGDVLSFAENESAGPVDDGEAFGDKAFCYTTLIDDDGVSNNIILDRVSVTLGVGSDPVRMYVYGGQSAEAAMRPDVGTLLHYTAFSDTVDSRSIGVKAQALSCLFVGQTETSHWLIEQIEADLTPAPAGLVRMDVAMTRDVRCRLPLVNGTLPSGPGLGNTGPGTGGGTGPPPPPPPGDGADPTRPAILTDELTEVIPADSDPIPSEVGALDGPGAASEPGEKY